MAVWLAVFAAVALVVIAVCVNLVGNKADKMMEDIFREDADDF